MSDAPARSTRDAARVPHLLERARLHPQPPRPLPVVRRCERSNGDGSEDHEGDAVPLMVYAARIGTRDPDALNITRKGNDPIGVVWAPSHAILRPALDLRRIAGALVAGAAEARANGADDRVDVGDDIAARIEGATWALYREAYLMEMRESYRRDRGAWERLLARERTCLVCYCVDAEHCHRRILGAHILPRLGAVWCGELDGTKTNARPPK